jgi:hypothetical protein
MDLPFLQRCPAGRLERAVSLAENIFDGRSVAYFDFAVNNQSALHLRFV